MLPLPTNSWPLVKYASPAGFESAAFSSLPLAFSRSGCAVISNPSRSGYSSLSERQVPGTGNALTESDLAAMQKKQDDDVVFGEIETAHLGYLGSQGTFYVGIIEGVGRISSRLL